MKKLPPPRALTQKAKQLKREKSLGHCQALDEAARLYGFSNHKHYHNLLEANRKQSNPSAIEALLKNISPETPFQDVLDILKKVQHSKESIQAVCDELGLMKDEVQSFLFDDFLTGEGRDEINFRASHFMAKEISISDLDYEINGEMLCVEGNYVLQAKLEFEIDQDDPISKDERFRDREFNGSFGVEISRDKKINFVHSDMGVEDRLASVGQFTYEQIKDYFGSFSRGS